MQDRLAGGQPINIDFLTDRLAEYLDRFVQSPPYHLVASSLGAQISVEYAARHKEKVDKLVLLCPSGIGSVERFPVMEGARGKNYQGLVESTFFNSRCAGPRLVKYYEQKFASKPWRRAVFETVRGTKSHSVRDKLRLFDRLPKQTRAKQQPKRSDDATTPSQELKSSPRPSDEIDRSSIAQEETGAAEHRPVKLGARRLREQKPRGIAAGGDSRRGNPAAAETTPDHDQQHPQRPAEGEEVSRRRSEGSATADGGGRGGAAAGPRRAPAGGDAPGGGAGGRAAGRARGRRGGAAGRPGGPPAGAAGGAGARGGGAAARRRGGGGGGGNAGDLWPRRPHRRSS